MQLTVQIDIYEEFKFLLVFTEHSHISYDGNMQRAALVEGYACLNNSSAAFSKEPQT